ncbi:Glyoxalase-like domain protein [Acididesulfobacillus acetoxydans]|nr:Glyoxalase-like domain protein [Acididesulfobacillus acetoxydans]
MDKAEAKPGASASFDQGFFLWIKQLVFFERYARLHERYRSISNYAAEVLPLIPASRMYGADIVSAESVVIDGLHHVGHLVHDLESGLALYKRLGFTMTTPSVPAVPLQKAAPLSPFGAANSHADFEEHNFVELATVLTGAGKVPVGTRLVPLQVPEKVMPRFLEIINRTLTKLNACLNRFEGLHILVFRATDVYAQAMRLSLEGIGHSGVASTQRQSNAENKSSEGVLRVLEIDDPSNPVPEGRLAIAGTPTISSTHPNGALGLIESILYVAEADLPEFLLRYEKYLNRPARTEANVNVFELGGSRIIIATDSVLETILPGEHAPELPAFVAFTIRVQNIEQTRKLLLSHGFTPRISSLGGLFVPAAEALGTAILFRQVEN